jgi:hypothetical protein
MSIISLNYTPNRSERQLHDPAALPPGMSPVYPFSWRFGKSQGQSGRNISRWRRDHNHDTLVARSLDTISTELPVLHARKKRNIKWDTRNNETYRRGQKKTKSDNVTNVCAGGGEGGGREGGKERDTAGSLRVCVCLCCPSHLSL